MYPFDNLDEFDKIRALGLQDLAAARLQLQLRTSRTSRTIVRIYYGPPGTGKTLTAVREAVRLADPGFADKDDFAACFQRFAQLHDQLAFVTFHQSLQYEDVVESIRPVLAADEVEADDDDAVSGAVVGSGSPAALGPRHAAERPDLQYELYEGPFMRLRRKAAERPDLEFVIVVDEINRGDISRILGPLISSIEPDKRAGADYPIGFEAQYPRTKLETRLFLPGNLHVVGTMNSADRNIALVDYALRRRFDFVEIPPEPDLLTETTSGNPPINVRKLLTVLNDRVRYLLDADHCVGHGYFARAESNLEVVEVMARRVVPLLREYFHGNEQLLLLVLGDTEDGQFNIHRIQRADQQFEEVFGVPRDMALTVGYRPSQAELMLTLDARFWDPHALVPAPREPAYAINAVRKIYERISADTTVAAPPTAITSGVVTPARPGPGAPEGL